MSVSLTELVAQIHACRKCVDDPDGPPLPHSPRPVLRPSATARLAVCSQAPGARVHASGMPFTDPSGVRLRDWMDVREHEFYDQARIAIVPMGFCFPGVDANGGDLPPRRECARLWHARLFAAMPRLELVLLVGSHAQRWHLGPRYPGTLTATVRAWGDLESADGRVRYLPLPHPSWRNNGWLKRNPWFEAQVIPFLRAKVRRLINASAPPRVRAS